MAENKTQATDANVEGFLGAVDPAQRRADARAICALMARVTGEPPVMWGPSIVGFGSYTYRGASGRTGTMCRIGFSPRKAALTLYGVGVRRNTDLVSAIGKHTTGKGCLYLKSLADIDLAALETLVATAFSSPATGEV